MRGVLTLALCVGLGAGCKKKDPDTGEPATPWVAEKLGRCEAFSPTKVPLFGDTHVHTALSLDAGLQGTRLLPVDAYRFAKGESVGIQPHDEAGQPLRSVQLARPLDWAVVSDHAEFLGVVSVCTTPGTPGYDDPACVDFRTNPDASFFGLNLLLTVPAADVRPPPLCEVDGVDCTAAAAGIWQSIQDAAEGAYDRSASCGFTSFVGYEWSGAPASYNLHRNVIFRNEQVPELPTSYLEQPEPEGLWSALQAQCMDGVEGCDVLAIPHNSNLSNGRMVETAAMDPELAAVRAAMEPLVEIFQHKGSSECWADSPAGDELCGFEWLPYNSLANANLEIVSTPVDADFVRDALGIGLELQQTVGVNPYQWGIVASTDTHLATPGLASEAGFPGHGGAGQPNRDGLPTGLVDQVRFNPGGLAVVWAEENSREAIFGALRRRETYGTSGPRITLRVFGGDGLDPGLCAASDFAEQGYAGGVPMGGVLDPASGAPTFAIAALRDVGAGDEPGTPLQRIQVVKGWLGPAGPEFQVIDVAGDPAAGTDLDVDTCTPGTGGVDDLCTVWTDPDFDPSTPAFWYVRVLETPTCRWHQQDCVAAGVDCTDPSAVDEAWAGCCADDVEAAIQERAWSSPIWYVPPG